VLALRLNQHCPDAIDRLRSRRSIFYGSEARHLQALPVDGAD
jgi:hypothetical protein